MDTTHDPDDPLNFLARRFPNLFVQQEVIIMALLCDILRRHPAAAQAFTDLAGVDGPLTWYDDTWVTQRARADLVGRDGARRPMFMAEAKIHHVLSVPQAIDYTDYQERELGSEVGNSAFVFLVPERRLAETARFRSECIEPRVTARRLAEISFEQTFAVVEPNLPTRALPGFRGTVRLYNSFLGSMVSPYTEDDLAAGWTRRAAGFRTLGERVTEGYHRDLYASVPSPIPNILPWREDTNCRYLRLPAPVNATPAIGLFSDLDGVPFALRYVRRYTPDFAAVTARLRASTLPVVTDPAGDHLSVRLQVPVGAAHFDMVAALRAQVDAAVAVAHPELAAVR